MAPLTDNNSLDLKDALATVTHIFEAVDALAYEVGRNASALEAHYPGLNLGPVTGMTWAIGELGAAIRKAKALADGMS